MPNWCSNKVTFRHKDPAQIQKLVAAYRKGLFSIFVPVPEDMPPVLDPFRADDWFWAHWGTKWDVKENGRCNKAPEFRGDGAVFLDFESAAAPPTAFYAVMEGLGFEVDAVFYEPNLCCCGSYTRGKEQRYCTQEGADWVEAHVPKEIDKAFGIAEEMRELGELDDEADDASDDAAEDAAGDAVDAKSSSAYMYTTSKGRDYIILKQ